MNENMLKKIVIDTIKGEQHLGENLKNLCVDYIEQQENKQLKDKLKGVQEERDYLFNKQSIENKYLTEENKQLKEELQKADSITQSCIFEGKEESTINFRECLNKLELYKEVIEEVRELVYKMFNNEPANSREYDYYCEKLLQILDKAKENK